MPQDPNPMYWGAMDRYQAHYIVRVVSNEPDMYLARTKLDTHGRFAAKTVTGVSWEGPGHLADVLSKDVELCEMISRQGVRDASIFVEPMGDVVRIHGKWQNHEEFGVTKEQFEIYDRIAGHIKSL